jgi:Mn2+/Fe2+ NRAMP family transporter
MTQPPSAAPAARSLRGVLLGAAFLMATSAIGPGFLTQTAVFTAALGASFGFAILLSILIDLAAQLNIWRVVAVSERRAQEISDLVLPGLGTALAVLVALGGLAFNIGNVAGAGLGLHAMLDVPPATGAALSAALAIGLFLLRDAGRAMDRFAFVLGAVMIALTLYVAWVSRPPAGEALLRTIVPERIDALTVVTLVGGTVGGYITFAGAHRLLDAGVTGRAALPQVSRSASMAILLASSMRVLLFLAALGVVAGGAVLDPANPPASVFRHAAGALGGRVFGFVMWSAAVTSVVGAAYTSVSFVRTLPGFRRVGWRALVIAFIATSAAVFLIVGRPVKTLILVGALNGLILPLSLGVMLVAAHRVAVVGDYRHPRWMTATGAATALLMGGLGAWTLFGALPVPGR